MLLAARKEPSIKYPETRWIEVSSERKNPTVMPFKIKNHLHVDISLSLQQ